MDFLKPLLADGPVKNAAKLWEYTLKDKTTKQTIIIENEDHAFSVYHLDQSWDGREQKGPKGDVHEKSVDGVLVAAFDVGTVTCFFDLKGTMDEDEQREHGLAQMDASVRHFAPLHRKGEAPAPTHGDLHHDAWTDLDGEGPQEKLDGHPMPDHVVGAVAIVNHAGARELPKGPRVTGTEVKQAIVLIPRKEGWNVSRVGARELCELASLFEKPVATKRRKRK